MFGEVGPATSYDPVGAQRASAFAEQCVDYVPEQLLVSPVAGWGESPA